MKIIGIAVATGSKHQPISVYFRQYVCARRGSCL